MLITQRLSKEIHTKNTYVLLPDGQDENNKPRVALRKVEATWGHYEPTGQKGGVCFAPLSDGSTHAKYNTLLGHNTGHSVSVQTLLLTQNIWHTGQPYQTWTTFIQEAAQKLLDAQPVENPRITLEAITATNYWYKDNWYGHTLSFVLLRDAKRCAKSQTGNSVVIYTTTKRRSQIACIAEASGHCPP